MKNEELKAVKMAWAAGEEVQYNQRNGWRDWKDTRCLNIDHASPCHLTVWRIKPKTIRIGDYDVPEPLREMKQGQVYWVASPVDDICYDGIKNYGDAVDEAWLARGLCHSTREAAELHAKALLSFTETK